MNARENSVREVRHQINDIQLSAFLRAIRAVCDSRIVELVNQKMDSGESLDAIFYTGILPGFNLSIDRMENFRFEIYFGFQFGMCCENDGWWDVVFDADGHAEVEKLSSKMPGRELAIRQARKLVSDEQLMTFIRAARWGSPVLAIDIINRRLDDGMELDSIFYTGRDYGFHLVVERNSRSSFNIGFGCQAGPTAGDSGSWDVVFDNNNGVSSIIGGGYFIS